MKLLLDTHFVCALGAAWGDLSARERRFFENTAGTFVVSAVSIWKMRIKWQVRHASGDRKGPVDSALPRWLHIRWRAPWPHLAGDRGP